MTVQMVANNKAAIAYSAITLLITAVLGQVILLLYPSGATTGSSVLFIIMNLVPMITAGAFSIRNAECRSISDFLAQSFLQKEHLYSYLWALTVPLMYYGVSALLNNVNYLHASIFSVLAYFPWTLLQGGLEEVGWRWYLQRHIHVRRDSYALKMLLISIVWFLWHIPIYRLPWITAGSSNYAIFYLMMLGNTFTFGMVKEMSKGAIPCILSHMLIDTMAVAMLVQSSVFPIILLVLVEIAFSTLVVYVHNNKWNANQK